MDHSSPFSVCRCRARRIAKKLRRRLRHLARRRPGKVPVLVLGKRKSVVVLHPDDAVFLRRDETA